MIYSLLLEYWYITLFSLLLINILINKINDVFLLKKLGAKPFTNYRYDYFFGFKSGYDLVKDKFKGRQVESFSKRYQEVTDPKVPTYIERIFGFQTIVTKDPENIKAMLSTQFQDFCLDGRLNYFGPLLGKGIFTLDGAGWKHSRQMLRPQFSRDQVSHVKSLEPHLQLLFKHIDRHSETKEYFDLQELFFRFTVDSATEFLFGASVDSLQDESIGIYDYTDFAGRKEFADAFNKSQVYLSHRSSLQKLYFLINNSEFKKCNEIVHKFTQYYINKVLNASVDEIEKQSGYVFLYELVKETRDPIVLRDQALNILVAGRDTTAGLLSFCIFELARNPEMWFKLRNEILDHFGSQINADITFESLKKCDYLKAVLNETLRMYPSVPKNSRVATKNTTLPKGGGKDGESPVLVRKGQNVIYNINSTHLDETYFGKDSNIFRPERWFKESTRKLGWAYLPFNGGPRICLGQQFALTEASYVITRLAQTYSILNIKPESFEYPPRKQNHLTMCLLDPLMVSFEK